MHTPDQPDTAPGQTPQDLTILSGAVRPGQQVTIYAFPAGRFGEFDLVDPADDTTADGASQRQPLGANRTGLVVSVEHIECPVGDATQDWTVAGVRVTFDDGTAWDSVDHAVAHWHAGAPPTPADLKSAEALVEDMREHNEAAEAAYEAEGVLADFEVHPAMDENDEHIIVIHSPYDESDDDTIAVTPEQAEQFALRLLRAAALARIGRTALGDTHDHHDH